MKVEREYDRGGALAYVAAWDVHRAKLFGRCEAKSGIAIVQRKVLTPNDFASLPAVAERLRPSSGAMKPWRRRSSGRLPEPT